MSGVDDIDLENFRNKLVAIIVLSVLLRKAYLAGYLLLLLEQTAVLSLQAKYLNTLF